jgi:hypothetical protein
MKAELEKVNKMDNVDYLPQPQHGYIFESHGAFHIRYYVHSAGKRKQRSSKLCVKNDLHPSKDSPAVIALAEAFIVNINTANIANDMQPFHNCTICGNRCRRTIEGTFAPKV